MPVTKRRPLLLAYVHLGPGTPAATQGLLSDYIEQWAVREGYALGEVIVGPGRHGEQVSVGRLVNRVRDTGARTVLVTGPGRLALSTLRRIRGLRVLTLADLSPSVHIAG